MDTLKTFRKLLREYARIVVLSKNFLRMFTGKGFKISKKIEAQY